MESAAASRCRLTRSASLSACGLRRSSCTTSIRIRRARSDLTAAAALALTRQHSPILEAAGGGTGGVGTGGPGGPGGGPGGSSQGGCGLGEHYRRLVGADPENPLLLRNYGQYLQDVEGDLRGAEALYARALLATGGADDAELLSLYARVLWQARHDKPRAEAYFQRAVQAAPDDCYVLGSYAGFLWEAEEEDDDQLPAAAEVQISTAVVVASCADESTAGVAAC